MSNNKKNKSIPYWKFFGTEPTKVDGQNAFLTHYYKKELRVMLKGTFDLRCPKGWDKDYLLNNLIHRGHMLITDSVIGVMPFRESLFGMNYINHPTRATIALPDLPTFERTLSEDSVLLYFEWNMGSSFYTYNDLLTIYATKLAICDTSFDVNMINSRIAHLVYVETETQRKAVQNAYDKISEGNPLVVVRKDSLTGADNGTIFNPVKNTFIATDIQDAKRTVYNEFLTKIGVNNANTDKKERLVVSEVDANNTELRVNVELFKERLKEQSEAVRDMFGIDFELGFKDFVGEGGGVADVSSGRGAGMVGNDQQANQ